MPSPEWDFVDLGWIRLAEKIGVVPTRACVIAAALRLPIVFRHALLWHAYHLPATGLSPPSPP